MNKIPKKIATKTRFKSQQFSSKHASCSYRILFSVCGHRIFHTPHFPPTPYPAPRTFHHTFGSPFCLSAFWQAGKVLFCFYNVHCIACKNNLIWTSVVQQFTVTLHYLGHDTILGTNSVDMVISLFSFSQSKPINLLNVI